MNELRASLFCLAFAALALTLASCGTQFPRDPTAGPANQEETTPGNPDAYVPGTQDCSSKFLGDFKSMKGSVNYRIEKAKAYGEAGDRQMAGIYLDSATQEALGFKDQYDSVRCYARDSKTRETTLIDVNAKVEALIAKIDEIKEKTRGTHP